MTVVSDKTTSAWAETERVNTTIPQDHEATHYRWRPRSSLLRTRCFIYLVMLDLLSISLGFLLPGVIWHGAGWGVFLTVSVPVYLVTASNMDAFAASTLQDPFRAIRRAEQALLITIAIVTLAAFYLKSSSAFSRITIAFGTIDAAVLLGLARYVFVRHLPSIVGGNPFSVILIRDGDAPLLPGSFSLVLQADSYFDPDQHDPAMYDRLAKMLATVDRVVVTCPPERRLSWSQALQGANIQGEIALPELKALAPLGLSADRDMPAVIVAAGPLSLFDRFLKRGFDVAVAGAALICLLPLLAVISCLIKFDTPGPILFKQTRIGRGNQLFQMLKFRSMKVAQLDEAGHRSASRDDDRVTRIGRFIRSTSIDELPQLINVLRGDMSIVGPRPHALGSRAADKLFWEVDRRYWDRHAAKPGLTGLAQVRGFRGATLVEDDLLNRLQADLEYLENWSIWRDVKIIFLTVRVILHRNAF